MLDLEQEIKTQLAPLGIADRVAVGGGIMNVLLQAQEAYGAKIDGLETKYGGREDSLDSMIDLYRDATELIGNLFRERYDANPVFDRLGERKDQVRDHVADTLSIVMKLGVVGNILESYVDQKAKEEGVNINAIQPLEGQAYITRAIDSLVDRLGGSESVRDAVREVYTAFAGISFQSQDY